MSARLAHARCTALLVCPRASSANRSGIPQVFKPLGNPTANDTKLFAMADLLEIAKDRGWLVKMTTAINTHWQKQNVRKRGPNLNAKHFKPEPSAVANS